MRQRRSEELQWLRTSPQAFQTLNQIAHTGPYNTVVTLMNLGQPLEKQRSAQDANELVGRICRVAADVVNTQIIEEDAEKAGYSLTPHALAEQKSIFRALERKKAEVVNETR